MMDKTNVRNRNNGFRRLRIISGINGWSILITALLCTGISLIFHSWSGIVVGLGIIASGGMEIEGSRRVKKGLPNPWWWLGNSQILFFIVITIYSFYQLGQISPDSISEHIPVPIQNAFRLELGILQKDFEIVVAKLYRTTYIAVILCSFLYQGGLYLYYKKASYKN